LEAVIARILGFPVTAPLMKFVTGLEILLEKSQVLLYLFLLLCIDSFMFLGLAKECSTPCLIGNSSPAHYATPDSMEITGTSVSQGKIH
jgi:hypothetical protein